MFNNNNQTSPQAALEQALAAMLSVHAKMGQREARMLESLNQATASLRNEAALAHKRIHAVVEGAGAQITQDGKQAVTAVAAEYGRAVSATSMKLGQASRTVWMWFGAAGAILLLVLVVGWVVLGYYRRELAAAKEELGHYENAVPVVQAFYASDVVICGDRICANVDANGPRQGDKRQYRPVNPRPQP